jgi:hypothetical protein
VSVFRVNALHVLAKLISMRADFYEKSVMVNFPRSPNSHENHTGCHEIVPNPSGT